MTLRIFDEEFLLALAIAIPIRPTRTHSDHGWSIWIIQVSWLIIMIIIMMMIMMIIMMMIMSGSGRCRGRYDR